MILSFVAALAFAEPSPLQPAPNMRVFVGLRPFQAERGEPMVCNNAVYLPMKDLVQALTNEEGTFRRSPNGDIQVLVNGKPTLSLPTNFPPTADPKHLPKAKILSPSPRSVALDDPPVLVNGVLYASVDSLAPFFGAGTDWTPAGLRILPPEFYADQLGILPQRSRGLARRMAGRDIDFGISPPARDLLV